MYKFVFVHRKVNTLSTVIEAEDEQEAREELAARLISIQIVHGINIPRVCTWECINRPDQEPADGDQ